MEDISRSVLQKETIDEKIKAEKRDKKKKKKYLQAIHPHTNSRMCVRSSFANSTPDASRFDPAGRSLTIFSAVSSNELTFTYEDEH